MKKSTLLRVLCTVVATVALGLAPQPVLAQHSGHGGGGGFHGGGGHYGYGGGHFYGGYHAGGYYGWRGGYNGWRGGYWGYPRYGFGWGFGIGFGWGPYWPTYPYLYGYSPYWGAPYYYPYYVPSGYRYPYDGSNHAPPPDSGSNSHDIPPAKHLSTPAPEGSPNTNSMTIHVAASTPTVPNYRTDATTGTANNYRLTNSTMQQLPPPRPAVQNAIQALRAMPPDARQRQIDSGRYSNFSPEERELLNNASQLPLAWEKPPASTPRPPL